MYEYIVYVGNAASDVVQTCIIFMPFPGRQLSAVISAQKYNDFIK